jgi:hypothetical protein
MTKDQHPTRQDSAHAETQQRPEGFATACAADGNAATRGVADWLSLAAAPTFAFMALLTVLGSSPDGLCSAGHDASPLTGMVAMYVLMSAFHSAPWLKLVASQRRAARRR